MQGCVFDHLVITAPDLTAGRNWVREKLGVDVPLGGRHPQMGTHNAVLALGRCAYLEVISIDPEAAAPRRPRWFGMDERAPDASPALTHWVVRVPDIDDTQLAVPQVFGVVHHMRRDALRWAIRIRDDGHPPLDGVLPSMIEWADAGQHPAAHMPDAGLQLIKLDLFHPQIDTLRQQLRHLHVDIPVSVTAAEQPRLEAHIRTAQGVRLLTS